MKFICILASSANLRSLQFDKFSTKKFKTLISRILILFKKEKKVGIDECVFAKNGRIISIQFCRKKKKSFCVKAASLICWASSVGFFVLGSLPAFGFNHACHRSWRVYLEQMIRVAVYCLYCFRAAFSCDEAAIDDGICLKSATWVTS